jgi:hypothetical protein
MRKRFSQAVLATTLSALALTPVVAGVTILTADAAYAKKDKDRGGKKDRSERVRGKSGSSKGGGKPAVQTVAVESSVETKYGNSWKTRIEGGALSLHSNEYGAWNSARRSPVAIANMAAKVRDGKVSNGAGAMIGTLVVAYEDRNAAQDMVEMQMQMLVDGGVSVENAEAYLAGDLTGASIDQAVMDAFGGNPDIVVALDGGSYSCTDAVEGSGACGGVDLSGYNDQLADLDTMDNDADLQTYLGDYDLADAALDDAQGTVQPKNSTDEADAIAMLGDIEQLLGVEEDEIMLEAPEPVVEEEAAPEI